MVSESVLRLWDLTLSSDLFLSMDSRYDENPDVSYNQDLFKTFFKEKRLISIQSKHIKIMGGEVRGINSLQRFNFKDPLRIGLS